MLEPIKILGETGVTLMLHGARTHFIPRLSLIVGDHVEQMKLAGMTEGAGKRCCRNCFNLFKDDQNMTLLHPPAKIRVKSKIMKLFKKWENEEVEKNIIDNLCLYPFDNKLWEFQDFDVFQLPFCKMHTTNGLFMRLLLLVEAFIKKTKLGTTLDNRFASLLPFPGLKKFNVGVFKMINRTASENKCISICLPFVLNGICQGIDDIVNLCVEYLNWRVLLDEPNPTDSILKELNDKGILFGKHLLTCCDPFVKEKVRISRMPKVSAILCLHII